MEAASKLSVQNIAPQWIDPTELATRYYDYQTKLYPPSSQVWPYKMKTEQWIVREILVLLSGCTSELFSIDKGNDDVKIDMNMQVQISSLTPQTLEQALQYWVQGAVIVQQIQTVIDRLNASADLGLCYRAFGRSLWAIMHPFKRHITELEANRPDLTLASLQVTLRWHMEQIKFIHSVVQRAILTDSFLPVSQRKHTTAERSSYLLTALYAVLDEVSRGDEEPFKVTLKLFLDSLTPLLNMVHHWMHEGSLSFQYLKDEFFVIEDEALDYQAPAVCWKNKFELRTKERTGTTPQTPEKQQRKILIVPSFMKEIAQLVLHTGKAIHLIQSLGKSEQWLSQSTHKQSSQHPSRASLMTRLTALDQLSKHTCTEIIQQIEEHLTRHKREEVQPLDHYPHDLADMSANDVMTTEDEVMAVMNKLKALVGTREDSPQLSKDLFRLAGPQPIPVQVLKPRAVDSQHFDYASVTLPIMPISFLVSETLHDVIERKYNTVNQYLLNVLITDCRLLDHLRTLRQFFFLENGFVWHLFIKNVFDFLQQDGTKYLNVVELNHMLQESIHEDKSVPFSDLILIQLVNPAMSQSSMNKTRVNQTQLSGNATIDINVNQTFMSSQSVVAPVHMHTDVPATPGNRVEHEGIESEEVFIKNLNDTDKIRLSYRVSFPLDILLSSDVLAEYNNIMSFIFRIKRSKFVLDQLLFIHKETTGLTDLKVKSASVNLAKGKNEMTPALRDMKAFYHKLNLFRGTLIHFVNNLQHYVGTRVVEMAWNELADEIKSAKDFDYLIDFHQRYLSSIRDKCLLNKNVSRLRLLITRILDMSMVLKSLYDIMPSYVSLSAVTKEKLNANYERIVDDFNQSHKLLTTVLHQIVQQKRLPHLEDLLVKLNYNNYYNYNNAAINANVVLAKK